ncbi:hypothetical protein AAMO2058_001115000 [Amorphochlora amoebiformis]
MRPRLQFGCGMSVIGLTVFALTCYLPLLKSYPSVHNPTGRLGQVTELSRAYYRNQGSVAGSGRSKARLNTLGCITPRALFSAPDKKKKRVKPRPLKDKADAKPDAETVSKEAQNTTEYDPEDFKMKIEEGPAGSKAYTPPKYSAQDVVLPEGWEIVRDTKNDKNIYLNAEEGIATEDPPILLYDNVVPVNFTTTEKLQANELELKRVANFKEIERERLWRERVDLDEKILFKRNVLKNMQTELEEMLGRVDEITALINKIKAETPEERLAREKAIQDKKREERRLSNKKDIDPYDYGIWGIKETDDDRPFFQIKDLEEDD